MEARRAITIRDLYPHMSEADLAVAEANLKRYVALIVRIYDRLKADGKSWPSAELRADVPADLTLSAKHPRIAHERSNSPEQHN